MDKLWSERDDALARKLWAEGLSASEIGAQLGRTRNAVIGRVRRLKLQKRGQQRCSAFVAHRVRKQRQAKPRAPHEANAHLIAAAPRLHSHAEMGADLLPLVSEWFQASPEERAKEGPDWEARAHMAVLALLDDAKTALLLVSPQSSDPVVQSENGQEQ